MNDPSMISMFIPLVFIIGAGFMVLKKILGEILEVLKQIRDK